MNGHHATIAAGPGMVHRLCCATSTVADGTSEILHAALNAIDDQVALVDGLPVAVDRLWRRGLRSLDCGNPQARKAIRIVHPSWWSSSRVDVVAAAAAAVSDDLEVRPRSWLIRRVSKVEPEVPVVEIAERLIAIVGDDVVAVARRADPQSVVEEVVGLVDEMTCGTTATVLIDLPDSVTGARELATLLAGGLRRRGQRTVRVDDARLSRLALSATSDVDQAPPSGVDPGRVQSRIRMFAGLAAATVVLAATVPAIAVGGHRGVDPVAAAPTTILVEGRVALTVPANWTTQRVIAGPGSARLQVTSQSDREVALHITQSLIPDETLSTTADRLKLAIDGEPAGVFVDFNPSGFTAGRPAVTYREVRASHHVRWTVLVDGPVRISIGCQSRPGGEDAVRDVCEEAVRSAHAIA
ncbi:type VII secretion-associated protein [Mycobacterium ahvazicum]|uniref:Type VII secretion-associated protein n=1 Tax=Mycobacterium ahvazicum TaxID=1964395 RepID=A0A2K4Y6A2_9MYCO|nr:type VII secretion-associated protein [Mycobacterium ahvazicum]SOX52319.1 type VII secretion-associated protein [Mycobacterium ahvazicum]